MDTHRETYNEWTTKNESLLKRIEQLESDIDLIQHSIDAKQNEINQLHHDKNIRTKQQQKIDAYNTIFNSNILYDIDSQPPSTTVTSLNESIGLTTIHGEQRKRRDITEQLLTSTARVCHKVERIWSGRPTSVTSSNSSNNGISLADCKALQQDIRQLMEKQSSKEYLASLALLLQHDDEQFKQLLPNDEMAEISKQSDDKENSTPVPVTGSSNTNTTENADRINQKLDWIEQQQKERLEHVWKTEQVVLDMKSQMKILETQLEHQVKSRYSDPEVQTALLNCVMAKVENAEQSSRLASYESYLDEMKDIASALEKKHGSLDEIQKETVNAIKNVTQQRKNIKAIKTINQRELEFRTQKEQVAQLMESIRTLRHQLLTDIQDRPTLLALKSQINERLESPIDHVKHSLGCFHSMAPGKVVEDIESLLERLHLLSPPHQASVHHELEALALSWTEELKEKRIDPPEENPNQDTIDTVVDSVRIIQEHVEKDWNDFVQQQQAQLSIKVDTIEENRKYLENIQLLLKEREKIKKGHVGNDYTAQDRNLEEWFQLLDQM